MLSGIYAIVDRSLCDAPLDLLEAVLDGGVRVVQYRAKAGVDRALVRALAGRARARGALLIVNDDLEAALEADGLHVGQEDLVTYGGAGLRARLGARIFGISCGLASEALGAERLGADYVGTGPFAPTATKGDAGEAIGAQGVRRVVEATRLPVAAIGGIGLAALPEVAASGAAMAAVASAIARASDPRAAAAALVARWRTLVP
jgi:thiamine-phosphate pyrophosphorylase